MKVIRPRAPRKPSVTPPRARTLLLPAGIAITLIGGLDLLFLWIPPNFGSLEWEFGTIAAHFDGMPLATIGLSWIGLVLANGSSVVAARTYAAVMGIGTLVITLLAVMYVLSLAPAAQAVAPELRGALGRAATKTSVFALLYIGLYGWLAVLLWRRGGRVAPATGDTESG